MGALLYLDTQENACTQQVLCKQTLKNSKDTHVR